VSHTQLRGHEVGCRFSVVMKGGDAAYASAECSGDSCEWLSSILLYVEHGVLYVSGRNAKEKCFG
jgi:hypothetical protein